MNTIPQTNELHVIFGAGPLGSALMKQLAANGKRVRIVNRRGNAQAPQGVEVVKGDATDSASARAVCQGATVVYNCANAPYTEWPAVFPKIQAGIVEGAAFAGARLISAENVYMYGEVTGPMTEEAPYNAHTRKGRTRAQMAVDLMNAHRSGKLRVAIGRAADYYGPGVLDSMAGDRMFYPAVAGRKVSMLGSLDVPHTLTYIEDFAKGLAILGECDEALGQVWHTPNAETLTMRQFITLICGEAGHAPDLGTVPGILVKGLGLFNPMMREVAEMLYEFEQPFTVDHSKFVNAFGNPSTPHREAIRQTIAWFRAHPQAA